MERYIGLDAHSQTCTAAVMGSTGKRLRQQVLETNGKVLVEFLRGIAGRRHLCFEEGTHSEWLHELLKPHVDELVVVQASRSSGRKSDSIDSWALADLIRKGGIDKPIFKAPRLHTELRAAVRAHRALTGDLVRSKNRLHALFRSRGLQGMDSSVYDPEQRERWLKQLPMHRRRLAEILCAELDVISTVHQKAEEWLLEQARQHPIVLLLSSAPGIAEIRAAQIVATVLSPERFRTRGQFWSYCGLGIVTRSSSDWTLNEKGKRVRRDVVQTRGLTRARQPVLKAVFKGAALSVIQCMPNHPLHQSYKRTLAAGMKPNLARVTLARRIASAVLAMWKHKEEYDPAKHQPKPDAS